MIFVAFYFIFTYIESIHFTFVEKYIIFVNKLNTAVNLSDGFRNGKTIDYKSKLFKKIKQAYSNLMLIIGVSI